MRFKCWAPGSNGGSKEGRQAPPDSQLTGIVTHTESSHTHLFTLTLDSFPFDEQYRTITAMAAARAPVQRKTAVGLFDNYRFERPRF